MSQKTKASAAMQLSHDADDLLRAHEKMLAAKNRDIHALESKIDKLRCEKAQLASRHSAERTAVAQRSAAVNRRCAELNAECARLSAENRELRANQARGTGDYEGREGLSKVLAHARELDKENAALKARLREASGLLAELTRQPTARHPSMPTHVDIGSPPRGPVAPKRATTPHPERNDERCLAALVATARGEAPKSVVGPSEASQGHPSVAWADVEDSAPPAASSLSHGIFGRGGRAARTARKAAAPAASASARPPVRRPESPFADVTNGTIHDVVTTARPRAISQPPEADTYEEDEYEEDAAPCFSPYSSPPSSAPADCKAGGDGGKVGSRVSDGESGAAVHADDLDASAPSSPRMTARDPKPASPPSPVSRPPRLPERLPAASACDKWQSRVAELRAASPDMTGSPTAAPTSPFGAACASLHRSGSRQRVLVDEVDACDALSRLSIGEAIAEEPTDNGAPAASLASPTAMPAASGHSSVGVVDARPPAVSARPPATASARPPATASARPPAVTNVRPTATANVRPPAASMSNPSTGPRVAPLGGLVAPAGPQRPSPFSGRGISPVKSLKEPSIHTKLYAGMRGTFSGMDENSSIQRDDSRRVVPVKKRA